MYDISRKLVLLLLTAFVFGTIYGYLSAGHFNGLANVLDGYYFSVTTVSSTGYGDITPKTSLAKLFVMAQQVISMAILVAV